MEICLTKYNSTISNIIWAHQVLKESIIQAIMRYLSLGQDQEEQLAKQDLVIRLLREEIDADIDNRTNNRAVEQMTEI